MSEEFKTDSRPMRHMWAPGGYVNKCPTCGDDFVGDKRAQICADCAYALPTPETNREGGEEAISTSRGLCVKCVERLHLGPQYAQSNFGTLEGRCDFCGERRPTREFEIKGAQTI
jgi:hypothetical protein